MTEFIRDKAGATEAQQKKALAFLFAQASAGLATTGVLTGLAVTQTGTASTAVLVAAGAAVSQDTVGNGASQLVNDTQKTLDVLTANPVGGLPRNDLIVFDSATSSIRAIIGTPNASPTDPTLPATCAPLARIRNLASATTIPTAQIDDLRVFTYLFGVSAPVSDTGWVALTLNSGGTAGTFTATAGYTLQYRQIGNRVYLRGMVTWAANVLTNVMTTLPAGARPTGQNVWPCGNALGTGTNCVMQILVSTTGAIQIPSTSYYTGTPAVGMAIRVSGSFLVD